MRIAIDVYQPPVSGKREQAYRDAVNVFHECIPLPLETGKTITLWPDSGENRTTLRRYLRRWITAQGYTSTVVRTRQGGSVKLLIKEPIEAPTEAPTEVVAEAPIEVPTKRTRIKK